MDTTGWKKPRFNLCFDLEKTHQDGGSPRYRKTGGDILSQPSIHQGLLWCSNRGGAAKFSANLKFCCCIRGRPPKSFETNRSNQFGFLFWVLVVHPGRLTMEPTNHPFRKEKPIFQPNLHEEMFHVNRPGVYKCSLAGHFVFYRFSERSCWVIPCWVSQDWTSKLAALFQLTHDEKHWESQCVVPEWKTAKACKG